MRPPRARDELRAVEPVYLDVPSKRIAGLVPMPGLRPSLGAGMQNTADCSTVLLAPDEDPGAGVLALVETGEN